MVDVSDPELREAVINVRDDFAELNWCVQANAAGWHHPRTAAPVGGRMGWWHGRYAPS